jgi:hypothetical protein
MNHGDNPSAVASSFKVLESPAKLSFINFYPINPPGGS